MISRSVQCFKILLHPTSFTFLPLQTPVYKLQCHLERQLSTGNHLLKKMSFVTVKNFQDDDRIHIFLNLASSNSRPRSMKINLSRFKNEELQLALERLRLNIAKKQDKKSKNKKSKPTPSAIASVGSSCSVDGGTNQTSPKIEQDDSDQMPIDILVNGLSLELSVLNENAWVKDALLKVGDESIPIIYNAPSATVNKLPNTILEGCPLFPSIETEFTSPNSCEFYWKVFDKKHIDRFKKQVSSGEIDLEGTVQSFCFTPQSKDIGSYIFLACVPKNQENVGQITGVVSQCAVTQGPGHCPFEIRQLHTSEYAQQGSFRVMTYNLLADVYSDTEFARDRLFHYCPPEFLSMHYRRHLLLKEIIGYKGDLLCLQEVDKHIFTGHLVPALSSLGFTGLFKPKAAGSSEGCSTFVRDEKFRIIASHDITLSEYLSTDPLCSDVWAEVCKVEPLREHIEARTTILQVTAVESVESPGHVICLANTHLYFHPTACNLRLIQAAAALRHIQSLCDAYKQEGKTAAMVFCGDFNSGPHLGIYQLMTSQFVPNNHADWRSAEEKGHLLSTIELSQPVNIISACGVPPYTNYTSGFQQTLDYIYVDSDPLEVTKVVPMPSDDEVKANLAIPSHVFPSDHLALICDLKFR